MLRFLNWPDSSSVFFSRDISDLRVSTDQTGTVTVKLYTDQVLKVTLSFHPVGGLILLRTRDLLDGLLPLDGQIHAVILQAAAGNESAQVSFRVIRGGAGNANSPMYPADYYLSARPQIWKSYPSFPLPVIPFLLRDESSCQDPIDLIVYPVGLPARRINLNSTHSRDATLETVSELSLDPEILEDYPYGLRAYDFSLGGKIVRTIVMKDDARVRMFYFRNTFGQLEEIYSTGVTKRDAGGAEYKTYTNRDVERETGNDFKEKFITDTGDIGSQALVDYWTCFFRSNEHYIWLDGQQVRIILDEVSSGESTVGKIASFTFSWHLAEQPTGRVIDYGALEPYQYEVPEF